MRKYIRGSTMTKRLKITDLAQTLTKPSLKLNASVLSHSNLEIQMDTRVKQ